jgi:hypothetical protein
MARKKLVNEIEVEREKKKRLWEDMTRIEAEADFVELALEKLQDKDDRVISSGELRKRLTLKK